MNVRDWNPDAGMAFQGDVALIPVPASLAASLATNDEVKPIDGRLILQEGEVTGHHHAIRLPGFSAQPAMYADGALARTMGTTAALPVARLYRDDALARRLAAEGLLARADLVVAFLKVDTGPVVVSHEEHDAIRIPPGLYAVGRQVESAGAEERRVQD